jgi:hypothetical protein
VSLAVIVGLIGTSVAASLAFPERKGAADIAHGPDRHTPGGPA